MRLAKIRLRRGGRFQGYTGPVNQSPAIWILPTVAKYERVFSLDAASHMAGSCFYGFYMVPMELFYIFLYFVSEESIIGCLSLPLQKFPPYPLTFSHITWMSVWHPVQFHQFGWMYPTLCSILPFPDVQCQSWLSRAHSTTTSSQMIPVSICEETDTCDYHPCRPFRGRSHLAHPTLLPPVAYVTASVSTSLCS